MDELKLDISLNSQLQHSLLASRRPTTTTQGTGTQLAEALGLVVVASVGLVVGCDARSDQMYLSFGSELSQEARSVVRSGLATAGMDGCAWLEEALSDTRRCAVSDDEHLIVCVDGKAQGIAIIDRKGVTQVTKYSPEGAFVSIRHLERAASSGEVMSHWFLLIAEDGSTVCLLAVRGTATGGPIVEFRRPVNSQAP